MDEANAVQQMKMERRNERQTERKTAAEERGRESYLSSSIRLLWMRERERKEKGPTHSPKTTRIVLVPV